jgi:HrpA-like RNA helicase
MDIEESLNLLSYIPGKLDRNHVRSILELVERENYSVLIAPTGSGKSTLIPPAFAVCLNAKVFCSQPTIVAVEDTGRIIKKWYPTLKVGTASEGNVNYNKDTQIIYCTSGHLKNKLLTYVEKEDYNVDFCDLIILDEAHNGTMDNEVIMGLWKLLLKRGFASKNEFALPKILLASATLSMDVIPFKIKDNYIKIELESYPVNIIFGGEDYKINDNSLYTDVAKVASKMNNEYPIPEDRFSKWLIFCPGKGEIDVVCKNLKLLIPGANVLGVHSGSKDKDENGNFLFNTEIEMGTRMFVVSTNMFETSMTLDKCDGVFDTLTEKNMTQSGNGSNKLVTENISKQSSTQRKGRTGRVNGGFYYLMCSKSFYENVMIERRPPEIERLNLAVVFLQIFRAGIQPEELFGSRIKKDKRENAVIELKHFELIKLIDKNKDSELEEVVRKVTKTSSKGGHKKEDMNKIGDLMKEEFEETEKGFFVSSFEMSLRNGCLLWEWVKTGAPVFPGLVAVSLMEGSSDDSYFKYPPKKDMDNKNYNILKIAYYKEHFTKYDNDTQLGILLNIWRQFSDDLHTVNYKNSKIKDWCNDNSIRWNVYIEAVKYINKFSNRLEKMGYPVVTGRFNNSNLINKLTPCMEAAYNDKILVALSGKKNTFRGTNPGEVFTLDNKGFPLNISSKNYRRIIVIGSLTIALGKQEKNIITNFFPLEVFGHHFSEGKDERKKDLKGIIKRKEKSPSPKKKIVPKKK